MHQTARSARMAALAPVLRHMSRHKTAVSCVEAPRSNIKTAEAPDSQSNKEPVKQNRCFSHKKQTKNKSKEARSAKGRN